MIVIHCYCYKVLAKLRHMEQCVGLCEPAPCSYRGVGYVTDSNAGGQKEDSGGELGWKLSKCLSNIRASCAAQLHYESCVGGVVRTRSERRWASMGMILRIGSSTTSTLALLLTRQPSSMSQSAPSRYKPDTKHPGKHAHMHTYTHVSP